MRIGPESKLDETTRDRRLRRRVRIRRSAGPIVCPDLDQDVRRRLARVVGDAAGQSGGTTELQGDPIAAGPIGKHEVVRDQAGSGHLHRVRIDRRREIRERGHPIGTGRDRHALQPIVGSGVHDAPPVDCVVQGHEPNTRQRTALGIADRDDSG